MSATRKLNARVIQTHGTGERSSLREALWLAKQEIKLSWPSYPATAVVMLIFGFVVAGATEGALESSEALEAFPLDFLFLVWGSFLGTNFISSLPFTSRWSDSFHSRLTFLRKLPVPAASAVMGRILSVIPSLVLTIPAFFVPIYLLSGVESSATYVWFVGIWVGYALLWTGIWTYSECMVTSKKMNIAVAVATLPLLAAVWALEWFAGLRLAARTLDLARDFGPLAALASIVVALILLALISRLAIWQIGRREMDV